MISTVLRREEGLGLSRWLLAKRKTERGVLKKGEKELFVSSL
jgi:hypothetical protein